MTQKESLAEAHHLVSSIVSADAFSVADAIGILSSIKKKSDSELLALKEFKKFTKTPFYSPDKNTIRVIIVAPEEEDVFEEIIYSELDAFYRKIGCTSMDRLCLPAGDCCYFDDTRSHKKHLASFIIHGNHIYGKAIIAGADDSFQNVSCAAGIKHIKKYVRFLKFKHLKWTEDFLKIIGITMDQKIGDNGYSIAKILNISSSMSEEIQDKIKEKLIEIGVDRAGLLRFFESLEKQL